MTPSRVRTPGEKIKLQEYISQHIHIQVSAKARSEEERVLAELRKNPEQSAAKLAKKLGMKHANVIDRLQALTARGKIQYVQMWWVME